VGPCGCGLRIGQIETLSLETYDVTSIRSDSLDSSVILSVVCYDRLKAHQTMHLNLGLISQAMLHTMLECLKSRIALIAVNLPLAESLLHLAQCQVLMSALLLLPEPATVIDARVATKVSGTCVRCGVGEACRSKHYRPPFDMDRLQTIDPRLQYCSSTL
jgi:hypothetical protein